MRWEDFLRSRTQTTSFPSNSASAHGSPAVPTASRIRAGPASRRPNPPPSPLACCRRRSGAAGRGRAAAPGRRRGGNETRCRELKRGGGWSRAPNPAARCPRGPWAVPAPRRRAAPLATPPGCPRTRTPTRWGWGRCRCRPRRLVNQRRTRRRTHRPAAPPNRPRRMPVPARRQPHSGPDLRGLPWWESDGTTPRRRLGPPAPEREAEAAPPPAAPVFVGPRPSLNCPRRAPPPLSQGREDGALRSTLQTLGASPRYWAAQHGANPTFAEALYLDRASAPSGRSPSPAKDLPLLGLPGVASLSGRIAGADVAKDGR